MQQNKVLVGLIFLSSLYFLSFFFLHLSKKTESEIKPSQLVSTEATEQGKVGEKDFSTWQLLSFAAQIARGMVSLIHSIISLNYSIDVSVISISKLFTLPNCNSKN